MVFTSFLLVIFIFLSILSSFLSRFMLVSLFLLFSSLNNHPGWKRSQKEQNVRKHEKARFYHTFSKGIREVVAYATGRSRMFTISPIISRGLLRLPIVSLLPDFLVGLDAPPVHRPDFY